jgi:glycosyltransferase involved in cell wall biosynthesis
MGAADASTVPFDLTAGTMLVASMNLVLYTHPDWMGSQSQLRLVRMMSDAFVARGHRVEVRKPFPVVHRWAVTAGWPGLVRFAKWAGYVDQFILFPRVQRRAVAGDPVDTLYVFCDQALGPWVTLVRRRPHVVHCLDLLALRSALGLIPENPTSWTGRIYQRYIRTGFRQARHFISISEKSRADLHEFGGLKAETSEVVYLGQNYPYRAVPRELALRRLEHADLAVPPQGLLLHIGGGQWYKNAEGVIALYAEYVRSRESEGASVLPLWMISPPPTLALQARLATVPPAGTVRFVRGVDDSSLEALYSVAGALLFPSLAEGFGWPIAEGMACGCPVITTDEAPMSEVGGPHAYYLPRLVSMEEMAEWAKAGAVLLCRILDRLPPERERASLAGREWTQRFDTACAMERYLEIYASVLEAERPLPGRP